MLDLDKYKVSIEDLKCKNALDNIDFKTTEEITPIREIIGQNRAVQAIEFGLKMKQKGYNIYVAGASGIGRTSYTYNLIEKNFKSNDNLKDWVYVNNFKNTNEPIALSFKPGGGKAFKKDIEDIVDKLKNEVPKIFNSKEYEYHSRILMSELESNIENIIKELNEFARPRGFKFQVTDRGLMSIPMKDNGELMQDSELGTLTAVEIQKIREEGLKLNQDSKDYIDKIKMCEESYKNKMKDLDKTVGKSLVGFYEQYLINKYGKDEKIKKYIEDLCLTRSILECEACRLIINKKNNDFTKLLHIVGGFYSALQEEDRDKRRLLLVELNESFHDQIFQMTENISLIQCRRTIAPMLSTIVHFNASLDPDMNEHGNYESHNKIAQMLMDKNPEVIEFMGYHVQDAAMKDLLRVLEHAQSEECERK